MMEHIFVYICMDDKVRLAAVDSCDTDRVKYHFRLLFLELPSPMRTQAKPRH